MRRVSLAIGAVALVLTACGQVEPVLLVVSVPDCTYQGPHAMTEGNASLSLTMNGLGDSRVLLVELTGGHTSAELEEHFETVSDHWDDRPDWLSPTIDLVLEDSDGIGGKEQTAHLRPGSHVVVCVDQSGQNRSRLAASLEVTES